jgi:DNA-binding IclR family transcriptional regulator
MNISGQAARTSEAQIVKTFLPKLKRAADRIAAALRMRRA